MATKKVNLGEKLRAQHPWIDELGKGKIEAAWSDVKKDLIKLTQELKLQPEDAESLADEFLVIDEKLKAFKKQDATERRKLLALWALTGMVHWPHDITVVPAISLSISEPALKSKLGHDAWIRVSKQVRVADPSALAKLTEKDEGLKLWLIENLEVKPQPKVVPPKTAKPKKAARKKTA